MTTSLQFNQQEYDNIVDSISKLESINRSRALFNGMAAAGDAVKRKAKETIEPQSSGYAGDIIEDLPLKDAVKRRTMEWQTGPVSMTTIVTYDYKTTAQHGHLVEAGHVITPTKGIRRHRKPRVPGRRTEWRTGLKMGARTVAKRYIQIAATSTWVEQKKAIEKSIEYIAKQEKKSK